MNPSVTVWNSINEDKISDIKEGFIFPVQDGVITSTYGERINPITNVAEFHNGLDIGAELGTPVFAMEDGVVTKVYNSSSYGNTVIYDTDNGYTILYAHLNKWLVEEGEKITKGEVLGEVGSTGLSTAPHLHCTLWKNEELLNPIDFIPIANMY